MNTQVKVYVGEWDHRPIGIAVVPCFHLTTVTHPRNFKEVFEKQLYEGHPDIFSNNPYVVELFPYDRVGNCS